MKQARIMIDHINEKVLAIRKTKSPQLKRDYYVAIKRDKQELRDYCRYKKLNYKELSREILKF